MNGPPRAERRPEGNRTAIKAGEPKSKYTPTVRHITRQVRGYVSLAATVTMFVGVAALLIVLAARLPVQPARLPGGWSW